MAKSGGGINLGLLIEVGGVVANSLRSREEGKPGGIGVGNYVVDLQKLGLGVAGLGGQQVFRALRGRREKRELEQELQAGMITPEDFEEGRHAAKPRKERRFGTGLVLGAISGGTIYILSLSAEEREKLFKGIDGAINSAVGLVNELQGKPYSPDFEPKKD